MAVIKNMQARYPTVDCRIFIGGKTGILNPMVYNMAPGYDAAKYDIVWISTSRIKGTQFLLRFCTVIFLHFVPGFIYISYTMIKIDHNQ